MNATSQPPNDDVHRLINKSGQICWVASHWHRSCHVDKSMVLWLQGLAAMHAEKRDVLFGCGERIFTNVTWNHGPMRIDMCVPLTQALTRFEQAHCRIRNIAGQTPEFMHCLGQQPHSKHK